jgi:hypothetical protein
MIEELTPAQEKKIPEYFKKWKDIGHEFAPIDVEEVRPLLLDYVSTINIKPSNIVVVDSPLAAHKLIKEMGCEESFSGLWNFYTSGGINSGYCAFYEFIINEVKEPDPETMKLWNKFKAVSEKTHFFWVFEHDIVLSEKPIKLHFKGNELHNEEGPAVEYKDGFGLYCLNGVSVDEWLVKTKPEDIDPESVPREQNAEVRREIVKKMGIDNFVRKSKAKVIDSENEYELLNIDFGQRDRPFLKMKNPSIAEYHVEGVHPDCKTVRQALYFRNYNKTDFESKEFEAFEAPKVLT